MTADSIANIGRGCLMTLNSFSMLLSVGVMAIGMLVKFGKDVVNDLMDKIMSTVSSMTGGLGGLDLSNFDLAVLVGDAAIGFIMIGLALSAVAGIGIFGAKQKMRPLLVSYAVILVVIVIGEVILVVLVITMRGKIDESIKPPLKNLLKFQYIGNNRTDMVSLTFNFLMISLSCCGIDGFSDFNKSESWENLYVDFNTSTVVDLVTPISCCKEPEELDTWASCASAPTLDNSNYKIGCYDTLWELIDSHNTIFIGVLSFIGLFELVLVFFAGWLARDIGKDLKEKEEKKKKDNENKPDNEDGNEPVHSNVNEESANADNTQQIETENTNTSVNASITSPPNNRRTQQNTNAITSLVNSVHNTNYNSDQHTNISRSSNNSNNNSDSNGLSDILGSLLAQTLQQQQRQQQPQQQQQQQQIQQQPSPYQQPPQQQYSIPQVANPYQQSVYPMYTGQFSNYPQFCQPSIPHQPVWYTNYSNPMLNQCTTPYIQPNHNAAQFRYLTENHTPPPYSDVISPQTIMHTERLNVGNSQGQSSNSQSQPIMNNQAPTQTVVSSNEGTSSTETQNIHQPNDETSQLKDQDLDKTQGRTRPSLYLRDNSKDDHQSHNVSTDSEQRTNCEQRENVRPEITNYINVPEKLNEEHPVREDEIHISRDQRHNAVHESQNSVNQGQNSLLHSHHSVHERQNSVNKRQSSVEDLSFLPRGRPHLRDIPKDSAFNRSMIEIPVSRRENSVDELGLYNDERQNSVSQTHISVHERQNSVNERHNIVHERQNSVNQRHNIVHEWQNSVSQRHNSIHERRDYVNQRQNSLNHRHHSVHERQKSVNKRQNSVENLSFLPRGRPHLRDISKDSAFSKSMIEMPASRRENSVFDQGHCNERKKFDRRTTNASKWRHVAAAAAKLASRSATLSTEPSSM